MAEKVKLERQAMCDRLAMEFQDGWIVNLGVGCPRCVPTTKTAVERSLITPRTEWLVMGRWLRQAKKTGTW